MRPRDCIVLLWAACPPQRSFLLNPARLAGAHRLCCHLLDTLRTLFVWFAFVLPLTPKTVTTYGESPQPRAVSRLAGVGPRLLLFLKIVPFLLWCFPAVLLELSRRAITRHDPVPYLDRLASGQDNSFFQFSKIGCRSFQRRSCSSSFESLALRVLFFILPCAHGCLLSGQNYFLFLSQFAHFIFQR